MNHLNPRQQEALHHTEGALLVLAGAGSGKTSVITQKIAYLITHHGLPAPSITAMTFTNKAAKEMKERVKKLLPSEKAKGLIICTFHQFGLQFLRHELEHTPLKKNFSIMDGDDSRRLIVELLQSEQQNRDYVSKALKMISDWKNSLVLPQDAAQTLEDPKDLKFAELYRLYERQLRAYNAVDFDDLIVLPTLLLKTNASVRIKWQNRINYLLVDEYQDTNTAQYELIKLLVGSQPRLTVVGDDDQSIYTWRGAKPENMALLKSDFANLTVIKLEQNYRSTNHILSAANAVIVNNEHLFDKKLWSQKGQGELIRVVKHNDDTTEAGWVAKQILSNARRGGRWDDYAVLYRSNFQARLLEAELRQLQVPYKLSGGTSFFAKSEIKDIMGYLRLVINPDDDVAFLRVVNTPKRGVGSATLEKLGTLAQDYRLSLLSACNHHQLHPTVGNRAYKTLSDFYDFIEHYTQGFEQNSEPMPMLRQMIDETGYLDFIKNDSNTPQQEKNRLDNIESLLRSIQSLIDRTDEDEGNTLDHVIRKLLLLDMLEQQQEEEDTNKVNLMTLHAAKGLEFNHVHIIGVEEDILPHRNAIIGDTIEEERRLMYVGITRARETLTLSLAKRRRNGTDYKTTTPSRFIDEIDDTLLCYPEKANTETTPTDEDPLKALKALLASRKSASLNNGKR